MAGSVISFDKKNDTEGKVLESFLVRNRLPVIVCVAVVVVAAVAVSIVAGVLDSTKKRNLSKIDSIEYTLVKSGSSDSAEDRENAALEALGPFLSLSGVAGVRANMLAGDIYFAKKDYVSAFGAYLAAARAGKKNYTVPLCYHNAAASAEEQGDYKNAAVYYELAANSSDYLLASHSLLSLGRVREADSDFAGAKEAYDKIVSDYSTSDWADVARSRLIVLSSKELIEK